MKKIFLVTIFVSSLCFAQNNQSSLLELRNNLDVTLESSYTTSFQTTLEKKKPGVALIYSFLLPGMGELYADGYDSGIYFTAADVAIWGTLFGMNIYSNWQKDNYKSFAVTNAQINPEGKKDQYYSDISGYLSIDSFNEEKMLNRNFDETYNTETHYWDWANHDARREYREMWSSSEQAFNNVRFAVGALLLNRVVSMINAIRLVNKYNKALDTDNLPKVSIGLDRDPNFKPYFTLNISQSF